MSLSTQTGSSLSRHGVIVVDYCVVLFYVSTLTIVSTLSDAGRSNLSHPQQSELLNQTGEFLPLIPTEPYVVWTWHSV